MENTCADEVIIGTKRIKQKTKNLLGFILYGLVLCFNPPRKPKDNLQYDIVVIFMGALGDFLVFCSYAAALRKKRRRITLICKKDNGIRQMANISGLFDSVIEVDNKIYYRIHNIRKLKSLNCNTVICLPLGRHILPDVYANSIRAIHRVAAETMLDCTLPSLKRFVDRRCSELIPITAKNEWDRYQQFFAFFGVQKSDVIIPFRLEYEVHEKKRYVAVFPGSGGSIEKQWPVEKFAAVLKRLVKDQSVLRVYIMGNQADQICCAALAEELKNDCNAVNYSGKTSISDTIKILSECVLCIANDSGGAHLSMACSVPTVIICGMWQPERFYPNPKISSWCKCAEPKNWKHNSCGMSFPNCKNHMEAARCISYVEVDDVYCAAKELMIQNRRNNDNARKEGII